MNIINKIELKLEKFEKCHLVSDLDCSLGVLYDYSCQLQAFLLEKMKRAHEAQEEIRKESDKTSE